MTFLPLIKYQENFPLSVKRAIINITEKLEKKDGEKLTEFPGEVPSVSGNYSI